MIRRVLKTGLITLSISFPFNLYEGDSIEGTKTEKSIDLTEIQKETGWSRLKKIFGIDEFGYLSKEIQTILHVAGMSSIVGAVYGGFIYSRNAYIDFIKNNQATAFKDHLDAKKKLQDKVSLSFGKGAWVWGTRLTIFCTTYTAACTFIATYRGKSGIIEYTLAGSISGALYKFQLGPRGWIVGGIVGSALGFMAGLCTIGLVQITGISMDEARYWQYYWQQERQRYFNEGRKKAQKEEEMTLLKYHDEKLSESANDKVLEEIK